jgi:hypothetical protein
VAPSQIEEDAPVRLIEGNRAAKKRRWVEVSDSFPIRTVTTRRSSRGDVALAVRAAGRSVKMGHWGTFLLLLWRHSSQREVSLLTDGFRHYMILGPLPLA